jgi:hypothetical protein
MEHTKIQGVTPIRARMGPSLALALFCLIGLASAATQPNYKSSSIKVKKTILGLGIKDKEITGVATAFKVSDHRVYCWSKIKSKHLPTLVRHVWYVDDKKIAEVPLSINVSPTRTWSSKAIWPGQWKVEIVNDNRDHILSSVEFLVAE